MGIKKAVNTPEREIKSSAVSWVLVSIVTGQGGLQTEPDFA